MADLKGINLAMQTPFDENGAIDYSVFEELIEKYVVSRCSRAGAWRRDRATSLPY